MYIQSSYSNFYRKVNKRYDELIKWHLPDNDWSIAVPQEKKEILDIIKKASGSL